MAQPKRPFTDEERVRRDAIFAAAKARGLTRRDMARFAGLDVGAASDMRLSRWAHGTQPLPPEMIDAIEAGVNGMAPSIGPCSPPEQVIGDSIAEAERLAGVGNAEELCGLARQHCKTAVGTLVKLMLCSTSESVKLRSAELLLEYGDGHAPPPVVDSPSGNCGVYFVQQGSDGPIKIGFSNDVSKRLCDLQVANPAPLRLLRVVSGDMETEARFHAAFHRFRLLGEWFRPVPEILKIATCEESKALEVANG